MVFKRWIFEHCKFYRKYWLIRRQSVEPISCVWFAHLNMNYEQLGCYSAWVQIGTNRYKTVTNLINLPETFKPLSNVNTVGSTVNRFSHFSHSSYNSPFTEFNGKSFACSKACSLETLRCILDSTPLSDLKVLNSKPSRSRLDPGDSGLDCSSSKSIQRSLLIAFKRHPNSTPIWKRRFSRMPCASSGSAKPFSLDNNLARRTLFQKVFNMC